MKIYGYVRCSTAEQNENRQLDAMAAMGVSKAHLYIDKQSGKDFNRPAYQRLLRKLTSGSLLYIESIDRLGRNYADIQDQWRMITKEKGADIVVLNMPLLDTRRSKDLMGTFVTDLVLQVLSFVAQNECENTSHRQAQGIAAAKARGVHLGRPKKSLPECFSCMFRQWEKGELSLEQMLTQCNMGRSTFYRKLREYQQKEKQPVPKGTPLETGFYASSIP